MKRTFKEVIAGYQWRFLRIALLAAALSMACVSCAATVKLTSDSVLEEVHDNEIAALDKYAGQDVTITGQVDEKGLKTFEEYLVSVEPFGSRGWGATRGKAVKESHQRAYVSLKPFTETRGSVVCFFSDHERAGAARLVRGDEVSLRGTVYRVKRYGEYALVLMDDCSLEEGASPETSGE